MKAIVYTEYASPDVLALKDDLAFIKGLLESGKIKPVIDRCYPLREVPEALRYLEEGHVEGKVVITVTHKN